MSDVLTGKLDTIDVEDVLNSKYDSKKMVFGNVVSLFQVQDCV